MKRSHMVFIASIVIMVFIEISLSYTLIFAQQPNDQAEKNVTFQWTFGAIRKSQSGSEFKAITRDTVLETGDKIKFFLRAEKSCFIYLIYQSSEGDLTVLFPYRFKLLDDGYEISKDYYIPNGNRWFELDDYTGTEKFYLIATANRLSKLEDLIIEYETVDKSNKIVLGEKIISETRRLRKKHHNLKSQAERPVTIIGQLRGDDKTNPSKLRNLRNHAVETSAGNFFIRTFTIEHR